MIDIIGSHWVKYEWFDEDVYNDNEHELSDDDELIGEEWELTEEEREYLKDDFLCGQTEGTFYRSDEDRKSFVCSWEIDRGSHF